MSYLTSITRDLLCKKCEENIITDGARKKAGEHGIKPQYCLSCLNRFGFNLEKEEPKPLQYEAPLFPIPKAFLADETTIARIGVLLDCRDEQIRRLALDGFLKSRRIGKVRAIKKISVLKLIEGVATGREDYRNIPADISEKIVINRKEMLASYASGALD